MRAATPGAARAADRGPSASPPAPRREQRQHERAAERPRVAFDAWAHRAARARDRFEAVDLGVDAGELAGVAPPEETPPGGLRDAAQRGFVDFVTAAGCGQAEPEQRQSALATEGHRVDA